MVIKSWRKVWKQAARFRCRFMAVLAAVLVLGSAVGCGGLGKTSGRMVLSPAQLNEDEQAIARLLSMSGNTHIYDFAVDHSQSEVQVQLYVLGSDGQWQTLDQSSGRMNKEDGRMALNLDGLPQTMTVSVYGNDGDGFSYTGSDDTASADEVVLEGAAADEDTTDLMVSRITTFLQEPREIVYGTEIPVAMQTVKLADSGAVMTNTSPQLEAFFAPESLTVDETLQHYAVTVTFTID